MTTSVKPRVIKDYDKLDVTIQEQIKLEYPYGFEENLVSFTNREGKRVSALPFEAEDRYYLVRMTVAEAQRLIEDDADYDSQGNLREEAKVEYTEKLALPEDAEGDDDDHDPYADKKEESDENEEDEDEEEY